MGLRHRHTPAHIKRPHQLGPRRQLLPRRQLDRIRQHGQHRPPLGSPNRASSRYPPTRPFQMGQQPRLGTLPPPNPRASSPRLCLQRRHHPHLGLHLQTHRPRPLGPQRFRVLCPLGRHRKHLHILARQNRKNLVLNHRHPHPHPLRPRPLGQPPRPLNRPRPPDRLPRPHGANPLYRRRKNRKSALPLRKSHDHQQHPHRTPRLGFRRLHHVSLVPTHHHPIIPATPTT